MRYLECWVEHSVQQILVISKQRHDNSKQKGYHALQGIFSSLMLLPYSFVWLSNLASVYLFRLLVCFPENWLYSPTHLTAQHFLTPLCTFPLILIPESGIPRVLFLFVHLTRQTYRQVLYKTSPDSAETQLLISTVSV